MMLIKIELALFGLLILLSVGVMRSRYKHANQIDRIFAGRKSRSTEGLYTRYFLGMGIQVCTIEKVLDVMAETFQVNASLLLPEDSFEGNLSYLLTLHDDIEIELIENLEERFSISISDTEPERIKTIHDMVLFVSQKMKSQYPVNSAYPLPSKPPVALTRPSQ
ncbi:hypothetical protein [Algicola sagamiensis]|uniref:hypothetical protein n=1 Tax=Algicola sagamiensis TaxID=163869 RepID=UPI0012FCE809|nr:hypothetical protein [Algicola sagamiensis]